MNNLAKDVFVDLITVIIGVMVTYCIIYTVDPELVKGFDHWWSIVGSFFITRFLIHLLCEYSGINGWIM